MAYTETTYTGYGTRVKNSFKAIGTGFMLFLAGTALLWWNEGRAVKTNDMLNEAEACIVADTDRSASSFTFQNLETGLRYTLTYKHTVFSFRNC